MLCAGTNPVLVFIAAFLLAAPLAAPLATHSHTSLDQYNDQQLAELSREDLLELVLRDRWGRRDSPIRKLDLNPEQTREHHNHHRRRRRRRRLHVSHHPRNMALAHTVRIVKNLLVASGTPVFTVAQLQATLDSSPDTVFSIEQSQWDIDTAKPLPIILRSNRSLIMDDATLISSSVTVPPVPLQRSPQWGGALLVISGENIAVSGGRFLQLSEDMATGFAIVMEKSRDVKLRDGLIQGNFENSCIVNFDDYWIDGYTPPVGTTWPTFNGLVSPPNLITNMTIRHHPNATQYNSRGIWLVMSQNIIITRNNIWGNFVFGIDLDSSSSANIVASNYVNGCSTGGVVTEYGATHNILVNNHVQANGVYNIYINGHLNFAVDNTVVGADGKTPWRMTVEGDMGAIHNVSTISNRVVANNAGSIQVKGVGCANYYSENRFSLAGGGWAYANITGAPSVPTGLGQGCIAGTPSVVSWFSDISGDDPCVSASSYLDSTDCVSQVRGILPTNIKNSVSRRWHGRIFMTI
jgi:parallel beta-helix repeat protein